MTFLKTAGAARPRLSLSEVNQIGRTMAAILGEDNQWEKISRISIPLQAHRSVEGKRSASRPWSFPLMTQDIAVCRVGAPVPAQTLIWFSFPLLISSQLPRHDLGVLWQLCPMPDRHNPDRISFKTVKKPIRCDHHLPIGEVRKLGNHPAGLRECLQPSQNFLSPPSKTPGRFGVVPVNIGQSREKLISWPRG